jgi:pimeloyl-ACP methyl ester carboxylesterase
MSATASDEPRPRDSMPGVRSHELRAHGLRTRVLETGVGEAEAVVFLHGSPGSANHWDDLLPRVGAFSRAVAFDLPGFGSADRPADWEYSPNSYATFIAGLLSELGIGRAHLVMADIGAVGLFWAAVKPEAFASAVLLNTGILIGYRWHVVARLHRTPFVGELVAVAARLGFGPVMRFYNRAPRKLPRELIAAWQRDYDWGSRRAMLRLYRSSPPSAFERIGPAIRRLDRPALVLWGAHDRFVPVEQAERQRESFPRAEVLVFEQSGHYPHLDDPDRVAGAVVPFLRRQMRASRMVDTPDAKTGE